ncbi:hypothetical protein FB107DRAFT_255335 [Schizophyllum commune]
MRHQTRSDPPSSLLQCSHYTLLPPRSSLYPPDATTTHYPVSRCTVDMCDHPHSKRLSISRAACADMRSLLIALERLARDPECNSSKTHLAEAQTILRRGKALRLLREDFQPSDFSSLVKSMRGWYAQTIGDMLLCYAIWFSVSTSEKYAALAKYAPASFSDVFRWLELVHPRNDCLHQGYPDRSDVCFPLSQFFVFTEDLMRGMYPYLVDNPHSLRLILDLWLNQSRYIRVTTFQAAGMMCNFANASLQLFEEMSKAEGGQDYFVGEMLRLFKGHSRRRVLRAICENVSFLRKLKPKEDVFKAWGNQLGLARSIVGTPHFRGIVAPKVFVDMSISAASYATQFSTERRMQHTAGEALRMLATLCWQSPHTVNLSRALKAGLFSLLVDYAKMRRLTGSEASADHDFVVKLASTLTQATIVRTFHARHNDLLSPESPDAFVEERFRSVLRAYRTLWPQFALLQESKDWKQSIPCSLSPHPPHFSSNLRFCRCGQRAYCSDKCQRDDWQEYGHRERCDWRQFASDRDGITDPKNVLFRLCLAKRVIERNSVAIAMVINASWREAAKQLYSSDPFELPHPFIVVDLTDVPPDHRAADDFAFRCEVRAVVVDKLPELVHAYDDFHDSYDIHYDTCDAEHDAGDAPHDSIDARRDSGEAHHDNGDAHQDTNDAHHEPSQPDAADRDASPISFVCMPPSALTRVKFRVGDHVVERFVPYMFDWASCLVETTKMQGCRVVLSEPCEASDWTY